MGKFVMNIAAAFIVVAGLTIISISIVLGGFFLGVTYVKNKCDEEHATVSYMGDPVFECYPVGFYDEEPIEANEDSELHYDSNKLKLETIPKE